MTVDFEIRADLDEGCRQSLIRALQSFLEEHRYLVARPQKVIVSRPFGDPADDRILAVIRGARGSYLGSVTGDADGTGTLVFSPPDPVARPRAPASERAGAATRR